MSPISAKGEHSAPSFATFGRAPKLSSRQSGAENVETLQDRADREAVHIDIDLIHRGVAVGVAEDFFCRGHSIEIARNAQAFERIEGGAHGKA